VYIPLQKKMIRELLFATNNLHKIKEVRDLLTPGFKVLGLQDLPFTGEIPETAPDLAGNALQKVRFIHDRYPVNCFADDTGLEVDALQGAPGVFSARYAGENATYADNVEKLLAAMKEFRGPEQRKARFRTVIALILNDREYLFEGKAEGIILEAPAGTGGFGYDPVFLPVGFTKNFAEMSPDEKNAISHRGEAIRKLVSFLLENR